MIRENRARCVVWSNLPWSCKLHLLLPSVLVPAVFLRAGWRQKWFSSPSPSDRPWYLRFQWCPVQPPKPAHLTSGLPLDVIAVVPAAAPQKLYSSRSTFASSQKSATPTVKRAPRSLPSLWDSCTEHPFSAGERTGATNSSILSVLMSHGSRWSRGSLRVFSLGGNSMCSIIFMLGMLGLGVAVESSPVGWYLKATISLSLSLSLCLTKEGKLFSPLSRIERRMHKWWFQVYCCYCLFLLNLKDLRVANTYFLKKINTIFRKPTFIEQLKNWKSIHC